jgi:hypothetical protein
MTEITVVRGTPTDEELAAVVAVLAFSRQPAVEDAILPLLSPWADPAALLRSRRPMAPGPGAWRRSALPGG